MKFEFEASCQLFCALKLQCFMITPIPKKFDLLGALWILYICNALEFRKLNLILLAITGIPKSIFHLKILRIDIQGEQIQHIKL